MKKIKPREVQQLTKSPTAQERQALKKTQDCWPVLVTVCALRPLLNEQVISLQIKGSDEHGQRLNGKAASEARLFCHARAWLSSTQRYLRTVPDPANQVTCIFAFTKVPKDILQLQRLPRGSCPQGQKQDGWLEEMTQQPANVFTYCGPQVSFS